MKTKFPIRIAILIGVACLFTFHRAYAAEESVDGPAAFTRMKTLAGSWEGSVGKPDGPATKVTYRVTANGHTLIETLFPGANHEMISMYHLDQGRLVLTHYCAMGNQPRLALDPAKSSAKEFVFDFTGGGNLDASRDTHIHSGRIRFPEADRIEAEWYVFSGGKLAATNSFFLKPSRP